MNKTDFLRALPEPLRADPQTAALAQVVAQALDQCAQEPEAALIYSRIENLPEELLDILAYDFKIDWYDSQYTLEEKRRTVRDSWRVRRFLGTKYAVQTALSAIYPGAEVLEWFQYDGEPYHFRVNVKIVEEEYKATKHKRVLERIQWYKNLRSWLDRIRYEMPLIIFMEQPGKLIFQNFHVKVFVNYWGCYCFNGTCYFDGSTDFNQKLNQNRDGRYIFNGIHRFDGNIDFNSGRGGLHFINMHIHTKTDLQHRLSLSLLKIQKVCMINQERVPLCFHVKTFVNYWGYFFNGIRRLDGSIDFNQKNRGLHFINIHICTKVLPLLSEKLMQKLYSVRYFFQNHNAMGNAALTVIKPNRCDGREFFNGTLIFNGKAEPKTESI